MGSGGQYCTCTCMCQAALEESCCIPVWAHVGILPVLSVQVHLQCVVGGACSQTAISAAICTLHPSHAEVGVWQLRASCPQGRREQSRQMCALTVAEWAGLCSACSLVLVAVQIFAALMSSLERCLVCVLGGVWGYFVSC